MAKNTTVPRAYIRHAISAPSSIRGIPSFVPANELVSILRLRLPDTELSETRQRRLRAIYSGTHFKAKMYFFVKHDHEQQKESRASPPYPIRLRLLNVILSSRTRDTQGQSGTGVHVSRRRKRALSRTPVRLLNSERRARVCLLCSPLPCE